MSGVEHRAPSTFRQNNYQFTDDVDLVLGRHHLSTGGEWVHYQFDFNGGSLGNGTFNFTGQSTNDALLDFMLGVPNTFNQGNLQPFEGRQNYLGGYVHDVMRVNRKLTAQLGVRWGPYLPGREIKNRMNHFDAAAFVANTQSTVFVNAPPGLQFPRDPGMPFDFHLE